MGVTVTVRDGDVQSSSVGGTECTRRIRYLNWRVIPFRFVAGVVPGATQDTKGGVFPMEASSQISMRLFLLAALWTQSIAFDWTNHTIATEDQTNAIRICKRLESGATVPNLKKICVALGLTQTGVKGKLGSRIEAKLRKERFQQHHLHADRGRGGRR